MVWISHKYTCIPSLLNLPPSPHPSPPPPRLSRVPQRTRLSSLCYSSFPRSCVCVCVCVCVWVTQSYPSLCNPMGCSLPGSSVDGLLQARIMEWIAIPFSRDSDWPRNQAQVSCNVGGLFTIWATRALSYTFLSWVDNEKPLNVSKK